MLKLLTILAFVCEALAAYAAGPTTQAVNSPAQSVHNLTARTADLHTATGDVATIAIPSWVTAYAVTNIRVTNCSTTPVLAQVALYTGAGATGTNLVAAGTITGATATSVILPMTLAGTAATTRLTASTIFVRVTVANVAILTCDVIISIEDLS
jgi:hypothetical protein